MIFAAIFAGGSGSRMGESIPKQFLCVDSKPIIVHTVEKFVPEERFEKILVLCPNEWINKTKELIKEYIGENDRIDVIEGGETRNDTLMNALAYIERNFDTDDDSIIVTHDGVRPFINQRIIDDNIKYASLYGACDTAIPATDTIVYSEDNSFITNIPQRSKLYQGQTPQSFNIRKLERLSASLTEEETASLTDACKIFAIKGERVYIVQGEPSNIKITYPSDLKFAQAIAAQDK